MYQFTFWFVYVVYVFDFFVFFGEEIVGILTVWGFRPRGWYKNLTVGERWGRIFLFWCGDYATVLAGTLLCIFRVLHANLLKLLDFFGRKLSQNSASL